MQRDLFLPSSVTNIYTMKKIISTLAIILITTCATTAFAQEEVDEIASSPTSKGKIFVAATSNGGLNFSNSYVEFNGEDSDKDKNTAFSLNPTAGVFIIDNLAAGAQISFRSSKFKSGSDFVFENKQTSITAGPFLRYYFDTGSVKPYVSSAILFGSTKNTDDSIFQANSDPGDIVGNDVSTTTTTTTIWGVNGGVSIFLNNSIAIDVDLGYSKNTSKNKDSNTDLKFKNGNFGLNFGFSLFL